jgi:arsenate reductase
MAEGWAKALKSDLFNAFSAGVETHGLNPNAVAVMKEVDVDITSQQSQHIDEFENQPLDVIITVCSNAKESCPVPPAGTRIVHHGFDDPPALAKDATTEEDALNHYRRVRDEIRAFVETLPDSVS